jgi:hypothetical protein
MKPPTEKPEKEMTHAHELREITELLIKHHGLNDGIFDLAVEFIYAIGPVGMDANIRMPGGIFGVKRIGLMPSDEKSISSVDAAVVNPAKKKRPVKKISSEVPA